jgi:hypothetical protein
MTMTTAPAIVSTIEQWRSNVFDPSSPLAIILHRISQRGLGIAKLQACCRASSAGLVKLTFPRDALVQFT